MLHVIYEVMVTGHTCGRPSKVGGGKLFNKKSWNALRILQVEWHPYSDTHLGVLSTDGVLRLVAISSPFRSTIA